MISQQTGHTLGSRHHHGLDMECVPLFLVKKDHAIGILSSVTLQLQNLFKNLAYLTYTLLGFHFPNKFDLGKQTTTYTATQKMLY